MNSRATILAAVARAQPELLLLPALPAWPQAELPAVAFGQRVAAVGGTVVAVATLAAVADYLTANFSPNSLFFSNMPGLPANWGSAVAVADGRSLALVDVAVLAGAFGVAENGAVWVSGHTLPHRALPFICQHLALVVPAAALVATMHEAMHELAAQPTDYGVFIAGPSKTADIEQSLVIGAHGPRSLTVFLLAPSEALPRS